MIKNKREATMLFRSKNKLGMAAVLILSVALLVSAAGITADAATRWHKLYTGNTSDRTELNIGILTPDDSDYYTLENYQGDLYMQAPGTNTGGNLRQFIWPKGTKRYLNTQVCATWAGGSTDMLQEGLAARITSSGGVVRGVSVTKNVIYGIHTVFNVHTWDSSSEKPFTQIAQFDLSTTLKNHINKIEFMPWRTCLKTVNDKLLFKIWFPNKMTEPGWSDTNYVFKTTIPADYNVPGQTGWYVGHIPPNGYAEYVNLDSWARY